MTSTKQTTIKVGAIVNLVCSAIYLFFAILTIGDLASLIGLVDEVTGETITPEMVVALFVIMLPFILWAISTFIISIVLTSINKNGGSKKAVLALSICLIVLSGVALIFAIAYINVFVMLTSIACLALFITGLCLKDSVPQQQTFVQTENTQAQDNAYQNVPPTPEVTQYQQRKEEKDEITAQIESVKNLYENNLIDEKELQNMIAKIISKDKKEQTQVHSNQQTESKETKQAKTESADEIKEQIQSRAKTSKKSEE